MKRITVLLGVLALFPLLPGCKKDLNPPVQDLPAAEFNYSVSEQRQLKAFTWEPQSNTGPLSNGEESINQLYVTAYNEVTIQVSANVNVSSSKPDVVAVEKVSSGSRSFRLVYKGDGASTIKLWNGTEGSNAVVKSFSVVGREFIDVTGLRFSLGTNKDHTQNPVFVFSRFTTSRPPIRCNFPDDNQNIDKSGRPTTSDFMSGPYEKPMWYNFDYGEYGRWEGDKSSGALLTFEGLEPENASFRTFTSFESEWDSFYDFTNRMAQRGTIEPGEYVWPNINSCNVDASQFLDSEDPTDMWIPFTGDVYIYLIRIPVSSGAKYFYCFRAMDEEFEPIYPDID